FPTSTTLTANPILVCTKNRFYWLIRLASILRNSRLEPRLSYAQVRRNPKSQRFSKMIRWVSGRQLRVLQQWAVGLDGLTGSPHLVSARAGVRRLRPFQHLVPTLNPGSALSLPDLHRQF